MEPMQMASCCEAYEQKKNESRALTVDAQWIGTALLLVLALASIGGTVFPAVLDFLWPTAQQNGVIYQAVIYVFSSPFSILPAFIIAAKGAGRRLADLLPFRRVAFGEMVGCVLFGFWGIFLGNGLSDGMQALFPMAQQNLEVMMGESASTNVELLAELLYICLVPALVEELAFRGVALQMLRKYGDGFAILVSGLLFGLFHGNVIQLPFAAGLGIVAGYITVRTHSLWPAVILHFCNNAMSCLVAYYGAWLYQWFGSYTSLALYVFWLFLGGVGVMVLFIRRRLLLYTPCMGYEGCLSLKRRTLSLLKAVIFDAALLINLATAVLLTLPVMI